MHPRVALAGTELVCFDVVEATFLHHDVGAYFTHGVRLTPGDTVLDVGANIGVFSAEVSHRLGGDVHLWAFEPVPPIFELLEHNARHAIAGDVHAIPCGLAAREDTLVFSYFPKMSFLSSAHRDGANLSEEVARVTRSLIALVKSGRVMRELAWLPEPLLEGYLESYLRTRMHPERQAGRVRPLSAVLRERAIERVALLKIDVEGAEGEVLSGIEAEHWARIEQVVIEVEAFARTGAALAARLRDQGYAIEVGQDEVQRAGDTALVYARRG